MRYTDAQFINCRVLDELCKTWSIAQRTCDTVRVKVRIRPRVREKVKVRLSFRVRVRLGLGLGLCNWPNAQRVWSIAQRI